MGFNLNHMLKPIGKAFKPVGKAFKPVGKVLKPVGKLAGDIIKTADNTVVGIGSIVSSPILIIGVGIGALFLMKALN